MKTPAIRKKSPDRREESLFERRPMEIHGFRFNAAGIDAVGRPTLPQWRDAMIFAMATEQASPFWVGALWNYADGRKDWEEKLQQAIAELRRPLSLKTLENLASIDRHVCQEAKTVAPSVGHAEAVSSLEAKDQIAWMDKANSEELTVRDLRLNIRATKRARIIEGQAVLEGQYRVIYADPPWLYGNRPPSGSGAKDHYPPMTIEALCKLPVKAHTMKDAVLFMWVTAPMLYENPGPREVFEAWGFKPKTGIVWDKVRHNWGNYVSIRHEHLIIATRGSCVPDEPTPQPDSVQHVQQTGDHSEKPEEFRKLITKLYTTGPYLELFGRERREGWDVFGNDARLWVEEATV